MTTDDTPSASNTPSSPGLRMLPRSRRSILRFESRNGLSIAHYMDTVHDLNPIYPCTLVLLLFLGAPAIAEDGVLLVHLTDPAGRPLPGIELELQGGGEIGRTDGAGRARIRLADDATVGQWVSLAIAIDVDTPDLVFVSPWDGRVQIPPFDNETENLASVVVAEPGSPILLENPRPLAEHIAAAAEWTPEDLDPVNAIATIRDDVAAAYGLSSQAVDASI